MMPSDLEQLLTDSLNDRAAAGSPVDPAPLLRVATDRGRRRRQHRRLAGVVALVAAVTGASLAGVAVGRKPVGNRLPADGGTSSAGPRSGDLARLAAPATVPGAITQPALVGTDPRTVHFSVDAMAAHAWRTTWTSAATYESADVQRDDYQAYVAVTRSRDAAPPPDSFSALDKSRAPDSRSTWSAPSDVVIGGVAGTVTSSAPSKAEKLRFGTAVSNISIYSLVWQPTAGLWATVEVQTTSLDRALQVAALVRFDRATRCAVPFAVGTLPTGTTLRSCSVALVADGPRIFSDGALTYSDGRHGMRLMAMDNMGGAGRYPRPLKAGPYQVDADPDGATYTMAVDPLLFTAVLQATAFTRDQVLEILGSVRLARTVEDPDTYE